MIFPIPPINCSPFKFVIFVSYGNDSIALIQWAYDQKLKSVAVVFTDTKWAADGWMQRVEYCEDWVKRLGFFFLFELLRLDLLNLRNKKKGFPTQRFQWCSYILKIEPGEKWLEIYDPAKRAICLIGVRREESKDRADFPEWLESSPNHGGRPMAAPFAKWTAAQRNILIKKAGFEVLPHRSRECKCINSNKKDMLHFTDNDWVTIQNAENLIGKTLFRPHRHMGAKGAKEIRKWANSKRGQYKPPNLQDVIPPDSLPDEDMSGCKPGWCEND